MKVAPGTFTRRPRSRPRRPAACAAAGLLLLGLSAAPGLPTSALAQGAAGLSAERSAARLADTLIRNLNVGSTVVVRPLTGGHTGLPDSVAKRMETLVVGTLDAAIPANMDVNLITGDDVHRIYGTLEASSFGADAEKLLASVLRAARADTVLACEPTGVDPDSFELRCSVTYGEVVCADGGTDLRSCERAIEVNEVRSLGAAHAVFPWRNPREYLNHVFTGLAWEIVRKAGLGRADAVDVEREGSGTELGEFVKRSLRREMAVAKKRSLGWSGVAGEGRLFRLGWHIAPWGSDSYELSVELHEEAPGGASYVTGGNASIAISSLPSNMRLSDAEVVEGGGAATAEEDTEPEGGESSPGSPFGGKAILVVETEPPGAAVVVGGERVGETPLARSDLRAGSWSVVLDHPWHQTVRLEGQVLEDLRVLRIDRRLVRAGGSATVLLARPVAGAWVEHGSKRRAVPNTLDGLPVGPVVLTLGAPGHHEMRVEVEVPKEGVAMVIRRLEPVRHGTLTVSVEPPDALVVVEGAGPYRAGMRLPEGVHRVRVSRDGYLGSEREVEVAGETALRVELDPETHAFTVVAEPPEAEVRLLDGAAEYRPGMALPPGAYRVRVNAAGWEPHVATVRHGRGATRHVVRLERLPPSPEEVERGLGLSVADRVFVQRGLAALGFDPGFADGVFGPRTRKELRSYQRRKGLPETGHLTGVVFEALAALGQGAASKPKWEEGEKLRDCEECPEMVVVPSENFMMGSPSHEDGRYDEEGPVHWVKISEPFAVGVHEVSFREWDACYRVGGCSRRPDDEGWGRGDRPVINVSWEDANEFVHWLSGKTGADYRLPSESEWEYAARGGTRARYWWGDEVGRNRAHCAGCGSRGGGTRTAPVGSFFPNRFGLHDVHGNVWEWTEDCWHGNYEGAPADGNAWTTGGDCDKRVLRGGSWDYPPRSLRSAARSRYATGYGDNNIGFRVARELD